MTRPSPRLARRVRRDFPPDVADRVLAHLVEIPETIPLGGNQNAERLQACMVLPARGDYAAFIAHLQLARTDWRDALVGAGLGDDDWPYRLEAALGRA